MRLGEGVEWGAHCAVLLAMLPEGASLPTGALAEYHGVVAPYLAKAMQALARAGIVASSAGRHGGYRLARPAEEVSLLDVVLAVDGDEAAFRCTEIRRRGPSAVPGRAYSPACAIAASMWRAEAAWRDELASVSIASIAAQVMDQAPPASIERSRSWLSSVLGRRGTGPG